MIRTCSQGIVPPENNLGSILPIQEVNNRARLLFQILSGLDCDTILIKGKKVVTKLKCKVCAKHKLRKQFS